MCLKTGNIPSSMLYVFHVLSRITQLSLVYLPLCNLSVSSTELDSFALFDPGNQIYLNPLGHHRKSCGVISELKNESDGGKFWGVFSFLTRGLRTVSIFVTILLN